MAFTEHGVFDAKKFDALVKLHFQTFKEISGHSIEFAQWKQGLLSSAYEFLTDRVSFYMIGNIINQYKFLKRVFKSTKTLIHHMEDNY